MILSSGLQISLWFHCLRQCSVISLSSSGINCKPSRLHKAKLKHANKSDANSRLNSAPTHIRMLCLCICAPVSQQPAFTVTTEILTHLSLMKGHFPLPTSDHPPATSKEMENKSQFSQNAVTCKSLSSQATGQSVFILSV